VSPDFRKLFDGRFPGFSRLRDFLKRSFVGDGKHRASVERYCGWKTGAFVEGLVSVPLYTLYIPHGPARTRTRVVM
jgi:hypothetical protein